jgi:hypothetical protein
LNVLASACDAALRIAGLGSRMRLSVGSIASDFEPTLKRSLAMVSSNNRFHAE